MRYRFRSADHPEADGRTPLEGEMEFTLFLPTEEDGKLTMHLGPEGLINVAACVLALLHDHPPMAKQARAMARRLCRERRSS